MQDVKRRCSEILKASKQAKHLNKQIAAKIQSFKVVPFFKLLFY